MPIGNLAGLYGILEGIGGANNILQQQQQLRQREQLFQQEQASERLKSQALTGLLSRAQQGGVPGGGAGMPQPMIPPAPLPQVPPTTAQMNAPGGGLPQGMPRAQQAMLTDPGGALVRGSVFGNAPGFRDPSDSGRTAGGLTTDVPGIALPDASTMGRKFDVTFPGGQQMTLPQIDKGPAGWTGRGVDISAGAARQAGLTQAGFPTDQMFRVALHRDTTQAGMAALQAGVPQPAARDMVQTGQAAINELDPKQFGIYSLPDVAQAVEKASGPDTDPVVKSMAIGGLMKLLQPQDQMIYRALMQQNRDALQIWKTQYSQQEQDTRLRVLETGRDVRAGERAAAGEEKVPPQTQAFNAFMKAHPNATAEQQQQFLLSGRQPRSAQGMALRTFIDEFTAEHGKPPGSEDIRNFQAGTAEAVTEARGVGQRVGSLETAAQVLDGMTPLLEEASNKVDRTEYPTINKLILAYQEGTGDQNVVRYGEMLNEVRYLYGRALGGGAQARVADLNHFDEVMNKAWSTGQVKAGIEQIQKSISVEREVLQKRRQEVGRGGGTTAPTAKPQGQQTGGDSLPVPDSLKNEDDGVTAEYQGRIWVKKGDRMIAQPGAVSVPTGSP